MSNIVTKINEMTPVKKVLISVTDKSGLEDFVPRLVDVNSDVRILSTGGTYNKINGILRPEQTEKNLVSVEDYTGNPEMQGGLVKTLSFMIYAELLGEDFNDDHLKFITDLTKKFQIVSNADGTPADAKTLFKTEIGQRYIVEVAQRAIEVGYIDLVVVNLYKFGDAVKKIEDGDIDKRTGKPHNFESARGSIDIGGPCMIRAAAKNFLRSAPVVDPTDYSSVSKTLEDNGGNLPFEVRIRLAEKGFRHTGEYDMAIAKHFQGLNLSKTKACYELAEQVKGGE